MRTHPGAVKKGVDRAAGLVSRVAAARVPQAAIEGDETACGRFEVNRFVFVGHALLLAWKGPVLTAGHHSRAAIGAGKIIKRMQRVDIQHRARHRFVLVEMQRLSRRHRASWTDRSNYQARIAAPAKAA